MQMTEFSTQYRKPRRFLSDAGKREKVEYTAKYDDHGVLDLVQTGTYDLYGYIQSHKDGVDIHVLLKRFQNGEIDIFSRVQGVYGDFTSAPKTFADMLNLVNDARSHFDSLPGEVKEKFGNNFAEYMQSIGTIDWADKLGFSRDQSDSLVFPASGDQPVTSAEKE